MANFAFRLKDQLSYVNEHSFNNFQLRAGKLRRDVAYVILLLIMRDLEDQQKKCQPLRDKKDLSFTKDKNTSPQEFFMMALSQSH